jgi:hypothetical protein
VLLGSAIEFIFTFGSKPSAFCSCFWFLLRECRNLISLVRLVHAACVLGP